MSVVLGPDWQLEGLSGMEASLMYHARHESFDLIVNAVDANRDGSIDLAELVNFQVSCHSAATISASYSISYTAQAAQLPAIVYSSTISSVISSHTLLHCTTHPSALDKLQCITAAPTSQVLCS